MSGSEGDRLRARWRRVGPVKRAVLVALGLVVAVNVVLLGLDALVGSAPSGPDGSSRSTSATGVAAWADLLEGRGVDVEGTEARLGEVDLDPARTLVVVDPPEEPSPAELAVVVGHVVDGGRLVAVGRGAVPYAAAVLGSDPGWTVGGAEVVVPTGSSPATSGVRRVRTEARGQLLTADDLPEILGGPEVRTGVEVIAPGGGSVALVADPSPFWNRNLAEADNAALALAIVGDRPVTFAEGEHGAGAATGWAALPAAWRATGLALVGCAALGAWSAGQRLGPVQRSERDLPPPRRAYVDALAAAASRARDDDPAPRSPEDPP